MRQGGGGVGRSCSPPRAPEGGPRVVEQPRGDTVLPSRHQQRTSGAPAAAALELRVAALRGVKWEKAVLGCAMLAANARVQAC
jgi:hypothetical protein